ncbi:Multidrug resistance protein MdtH [uncultured archaeon]|nr:Multidrug resistance protein MdtH [uncultured archaeon]
MVKRTLRIFYLLKAMSSLAMGFAFSTYVLFLMGNGLDFFQVNLVNFIFMASIFLLEIPTGAFADTLGRKNSVIIGYAFGTLSGLVYFVSGSFWMFAVAEILGALQTCFISGAFEAWTVDSLKFKGYEGKYEDIFAKGGIFSSAGVIIGAVLGGYLGAVDLALPWLAGAVTFFVLFLIARMLMTEPYFKQKPLKVKSTFEEMKKVSGDSIRYGTKHPIIFNMIIVGFLLGVAVQPWNMFWTPFFKDTLKVDTSVLGWMFAAISLFSMAGMYFAKRTLAKLKDRKNVLIFDVILISAMIVISTLIGMPYLVVFFFLLHEIGRGMWNPIDSALMNDYVPSKQRATIISFDSMISHAGSAVGLFASGIIASMYGIPISWIAGAIVLLVAIPFLMRIKEDEHSTKGRSAPSLARARNKIG